MSNPTLPLAAAALLSLSTVVVGCAWTGAPRPSQDFEMNWEVREPGRTRATGSLFLAESGVWGFTPRDSSEFQPDLSAGQVVRVNNDGGEHFLVVREAQRWGYTLWRLDDSPLQTDLEVRLEPVTAEGVDELSGLCVIPPGTEPPEACGGSSTEHHRWHLFALEDDSSQKLLLAEPSRVGLAGWDPGTSFVDGRREDRRLLAVRAAPRQPVALRGRVVLDPACPALVTPSPHLSFHRAPVEIDDDHPLRVEAVAMEHGADALVRCDDRGQVLLVPTLTRFLLDDASGRLLSATGLGRRGYALPEDPELAGYWIAAGAYAAVGDFNRSAFWIDFAIRHGEEASDELALAALSTLVAGGQVEFAIATGEHLTRRSWNQRNVPDYLDAQILLFGALKQLDAQQEALEHRTRLAHSRRDESRSPWYLLTALRAQLERQAGTAGSSFQHLLEEMEDEHGEEWTLAVWLQLALFDVDLPLVEEPAELLPRFQAVQADSLWAALTSDQAHEDPCHLGGCEPTTYGFRPSDEPPDLVEALSLTPTLRGWPSYSPDQLRGLAEGFEDPGHRALFWLAAAPLVRYRESEAATADLVASLREALVSGAETVCSDSARWRSRFGAAAGRAEAPTLQRARRHWVHLLLWWQSHGVDALCEGPEAFLTALERKRRDDNRWFASTLPILEDLLLRSSPDSLDTDLLKRAVDVSRAFGDPHTCATWSLGMSIGIARTGHLDAADEHLVVATNCIGIDSDLRRARNLVAGYIAFERAGGRPVTRDGSVANALDRLARRAVDDPEACVGLLPLSFHLEAQLPSRLLRIADRLQLSPSPPEAFRMSTASDLLDEARAAYLAALRDLQRGHPRTAARNLDNSRAYFRRIDHAPGLARIAFLDQVLYGGHLSEMVDEDEFDPDRLPANSLVLRQGRSHELLDQPVDGLVGEDLLPLIAALLIHERVEDLQTLVAESRPALLCERFLEDHDVTPP